MQLTLTNRQPTNFWDRMAPGYAKKRVSDPSAYEEKLTLLEGMLGPTDQVLEIGCGTGTTALRLAPGVARYVATDGSAKMIEIALAKQANEPPAPLERLTFRAHRNGAYYETLALEVAATNTLT